MGATENNKPYDGDQFVSEKSNPLDGLGINPEWVGHQSQLALQFASLYVDHEKLKQRLKDQVEVSNGLRSKVHSKTMAQRFPLKAMRDKIEILKERMAGLKERISKPENNEIDKTPRHEYLMGLSEQIGNQKDFLNLFEKLWKKLLLYTKKSRS